MKKRGKKVSEETQVNEDLEAFEEWEGGGEKEAKPGTPQSKGEPLSEEEELELPEFEEAGGGEEEVTARKRAAPKAKEAPGQLPEGLAELAPDVPVNLVAVIGKTTTNMGELIEYRMGQVIDLARPPGETVDLVANGRLIARGELVEMDGKLGVRILKMVR